MVSRFKEIWKDKDRRRGIVATTLVHLTILFALFFLALRTPLPLPGEEGVEVNFGYDEQGYGEIQSESAPPESQPTLPPPQEQPQLAEPEPEIIDPEPEAVEPEPVIAEEEIITQETEEAPVIEEKTEEVEEEPEPKKEEPEEIIEEKKEPEPVKEEPEVEPEDKPVDSSYIADTEEAVEEVVEEPKPVVNQRAIYPGTSKNKSGTNQGITQGAGDMGKPQGYKDSDKYDGRGGEGNGPSFSLGERGSKYLDQPSAKFNEVGTVRISIWVDREGKVVKAQVSPQGTTIIDQAQKKIAVNAALNSTFTSDQSALETQRGHIDYNFKK